MTSQPKQPAAAGVPQRVDAVVAAQDASSTDVTDRISELESRIAALEVFAVEHGHGLPGQFNRRTTEASDPYAGIHEADPAER